MQVRLLLKVYTAGTLRRLVEQQSVAASVSYAATTAVLHHWHAAMWRAALLHATSSVIIRQPGAIFCERLNATWFPCTNVCFIRPRGHA